MAEFTKERLTQIVRAIDSEAYDEAEIMGWFNSDDIMEMARQLLAGLEQEPVAYYFPGGEREIEQVSLPDDLDDEQKANCIPLYAAPQLPQPAVPQRVPESLKLRLITIGDVVEDTNEYCQDIWNACRAAMLGAEPVSQSDELPMDYLQGHKDGLEWAARLAEANHPQTGDWLYDDPLELAKAISKGPDMPTAPVQGWIPCSERMPEEIGRYWCYVEEQNSLGKSHYQWNCSWNGDGWWVESENGGRVTHWMPMPVAPHQEVK